jgi:hypothetical protein
MMGIEMMLSNMLGVKPEQMKAMFEGMATAASEGVETMREIKAQNAEILALLKGEKNEGSQIALPQLDNSRFDTAAQE